MRVVAGAARGRPLRAPAGRSTRPTSDRVREAVFSMLASMDAVEGAAVVDLFAGSGALGIEALSRGARSAVFVDDDRDAVAAVEANLQVLGPAAARAVVRRADAVTYARDAEPVDVAFADPPYAWDDWPALLSALSGRAGLLVAESDREREAGPGWETVKIKRYGSTVVTVMQPAHPRSDQ
ncbi:MAG: 16S rRNA (guanine(966)-N(2))-methyltransferase RsmD [Acidimicrobiaceae bacterium]|nr:16S rRNA (guanine(966)-N(2))-methyltransferase RsmD [Acidimicrobiaceae bacterium]